MRDQSSPSSNRASWAADSRITPSLIGGHLNPPRSRRFQISTRPVPSHTRSLTRSPRRARNTMTVPENGSCPSTCWTMAASPSAPLRKSIGCVAISIRTPVGGAIIPRPSWRAALRSESRSRHPASHAAPRRQPRSPPRPPTGHRPGTALLAQPSQEQGRKQAPAPPVRRSSETPAATHKADWDEPRGATLSTAPPRREPNSRQPSAPSPRRSTVAVAAFRSEPRYDGSFAQQLANYWDNDPWLAPPTSAGSQP